jgi:hypothetical protein
MQNALAPANQIREPRAARLREVTPPFVRGQGHEQIGQGDVGPEPGQPAITAVAAGSIAARATPAWVGVQSLPVSARTRRRSPSVPDAICIPGRTAIRPTEGSKAAVCYVRNTSTPAGRNAQTPDIRQWLGERIKSTPCCRSRPVL